MWFQLPYECGTHGRTRLLLISSMNSLEIQLVSLFNMFSFFVMPHNAVPSGFYCFSIQLFIFRISLDRLLVYRYIKQITLQEC